MNAPIPGPIRPGATPRKFCNRMSSIAISPRPHRFCPSRKSAILPSCIHMFRPASPRRSGPGSRTCLFPPLPSALWRAISACCWPR
ncbi:hypothetical protein MAIT1_01997 [Magnetofaba australis IT-1]|uniref:Uncharacterized protein n=1 Tax=Magnetofaba australis IT-1 TaxID=1434232 RepID=A0A1Y2K1M3_9PROT|nr:hypothetical protein MAIT1_01997 [Magnetofaba australis IT-1]